MIIKITEATTSEEMADMIEWLIDKTTLMREDCGCLCFYDTDGDDWVDVDTPTAFRLLATLLDVEIVKALA